MRKETFIGLGLASLFFFSVSLPGQEAYNPESFARVNYVQGQVIAERGQELGTEAAEVNFILTAGDKLITEEGLAEISFGRNNFLRLDRYSVAEIVRLPESSSDDYSIHLHRGNFYLRISYLPREKAFGLHTPDASFYILEEGLYRFEVEEEGRTEAAALEGSLEVSGQEDSIMLEEGESVVAEGGYLEDSGRYDRGTDDEFSRWNQGRDELLARVNYQSSSYLPQEIQEYEPELSSYGRWVYESPYGYVWVPVVTQVDWRPYLMGRWVWYPRIGWTWISAEPWGWAVYHYGRWHWRLGLGWYWIPTVYWGPAWVHWYWDSDIVAWCPLSYWNRPVVIINNHFYDRYYDHYYPVHSRALVIVKRNQLQFPHQVRTLVRPENLLRGVEKIRLESRQPQIKPISGSTLKVPSLKASVRGIKENSPEMTRRLSSSAVKSEERNPNPGAIRSFSASASLSRSKVNSAPPGSALKADSLRARPSAESNLNRVRTEEKPSRIVNKNNVERPAVSDNQSQKRITERSSLTLRKNSYSSQSENRAQTIESRIRPRYPRTDYSRQDNPRQADRLNSTERGDRPSSWQPQERKSSYNLPSITRPYSLPSVSVRKNGDSNQRPALNSTPRSQNNPSSAKSSSHSNSSSTQQIRKKNG